MINHWLDWEKKSILYIAIRIPVEIILPVIIALVPKVMIEQIQNNVKIGQMILIIGGLSAIIACLSWVSPYMYEKIIGAGENIRSQYSLHLFRTILNIDYPYLESKKCQDELQAAKKFITGFSAPSVKFCNIVVAIIVNILGIISYSLIIAKVKVFLIVIMLLSCSVEYVALMINERLLQKRQNEENKLYVIFNYFFNISHNIKAAKDIRLYNFKQKFLKYINNANNKNADFLCKYISKANQLELFRGISRFIRDAIIYIYLLQLVIRTEIDISEFVFFIGIVKGFTSWSINLSEQIKNLISCCNYCSEYRNFVENHKSKQIQSNFDDYEKKQFNSIKINDVCFKYPNNYFYNLSHLNFDFSYGDKIAIVGENGSGKSTFIKVLVGLYSPTSGEVLIDSRNALSIEKQQYFSYFSVAFQDFYFLPLSIAENICYCEFDKINFDRLYNCLKQAGIYDKIMSLPMKEMTLLDTAINQEAIDLSGGEKQKLLLARVLYKNSPIIILDEPTAALDSISEVALYDNLKEIENKKTIIYISHRLSSTQFCDKILFFKDGKIIESGNHEELMKLKGNYYKMFMTQSYYYNEKEK